MKDGFIQKSLLNGEEALEKINALSRKQLSEEEIYTFSVVLCDNEIDRDFERFTTDALYSLTDMFVGKSGIFDHSLKGSDQTARIYHCYVQVSEDRLNSFGEPYACLKAEAYMPRLSKNADLIAEIETGIKKEVSVGCAVASMRCSICGADTKNGCEHQKGKRYGGAVCCVELDNPTDAYEWSFVAVPAQPMAGVTKSFSADGGAASADFIRELEKAAQYGRAFKTSLEDEVVKYYSKLFTNSDCKTFKTVAKGLDVEELLSLKKDFISALDTEEKSQLFIDDGDDYKNNSENSFII